MSWCVRLGLAVGWCAGAALGQDRLEEALVERGKARQEETILVDLNVNYRLGYRDGSWVPVDVVVKNTKFDVTGHIEVRTYVENELQSPIYRIPAQSPKGSKKRFRLHCRLNRATRIEAMLYHKRKPVQPVPAFLMVRPIRADDLMGLVLDREPTDYGFLNAVFDKEDRPIRFYREEVPQRAVHLLADYPQCYEPYDVVILGDIEPDRISQRHRGIFWRYVLEGGVLVVCTGSNAPRYRGSWVEDLAAVAVGSTKQVNGVTLAELALEPADREGAKDIRSGQLAELTPRDPGMRVWRKDAVLATLRPLGRGLVATVAVDAASHLLQDTVGYRRLWGELCQYRAGRVDLNYGAATQQYAEALPYVSGIRLFSKSSVMLYLLLYFLVGIVANWLICNALKRRELAWLFLVFFSAGFTAYAMVFGTAGRAKSTQVEQLEVLRMPEASGSAGVRSLVSVLTARTKRLSIGLLNEFSLAEDVTTLDSLGWRAGYRVREVRPFYLNQTASPRIEQFMVGASELRLVEVHTEVDVPGAIEGTLQLEEGTLNGALRNNTGFALRDPFVLLEGSRHPVTVEGDRLVVEAQASRPERPEGFTRTRAAMRRGPGGRSVDTDAFDAWQEQERRNLHGAFVDRLFAEDAFDLTPRVQLGPFLVAWVENGPLGTVRLEETVDVARGATLLVADIDVRREEGRRVAFQALPVRFAGGEWTYFAPPGSAPWQRKAYALTGSEAPVEISIPRTVQRQGPKELVVKLHWRSRYGMQLVFAPAGARRDWPQKHLIDEDHDSNARTNEYDYIKKYRFTNCQAHLDEAAGTISGKVYREGADPREPIAVSLSAVVQTTRSLLESEDWKPWP